MEIDFYDHTGRPVAYTDDGENIYLWGGRPVAFLSDDRVYSFSGRFVGWFWDGWIRDRYGDCVLFTSEATGGPAKPALQSRPARDAQQARRERGTQQAPPARPAPSANWSKSTFEGLIS
jgi:hypothetical protein